jgi:hypothetical protein
VDRHGFGTGRRRNERDGAGARGNDLGQHLAWFVFVFFFWFLPNKPNFFV